MAHVPEHLDALGHCGLEGLPTLAPVPLLQNRRHSARPGIEPTALAPVVANEEGLRHIRHVRLQIPHHRDGVVPIAEASPGMETVSGDLGVEDGRNVQQSHVRDVNIPIWRATSATIKTPM